MIRFIFIFVINLLLTSCGAVSGMSKAFSRDNWITHRVEIGTKVLHFSIPNGLGDGGVSFRQSPDYFELYNPEQFRPFQPNPTLYSGFFEFKESFWKYSEGIFTVTITVGRAPMNYDKDIRNLDNLIEAMWLEDVIYEKRHNQGKFEKRASSQPKPKPFKPKVINGVDWLVYTTYLHETHMAAPLDNRHYLYVFVAPGVSERSKYYSEAKAMAEKVIQSFVLESMPESKKIAE
jgi:hypothetical protein